MKTKEIVSVALKIIGLIAFWKSIQTFGGMMGGIGVFNSILESNDQMDNAFMFTVGLVMVLNFLLPLIVAIIFLFRTEKVLSIIKVKDQGQIDFNLDKQVLYHMIIIVFGFVALLHGTGNFIEFNYKKDTKKEYTIKNVLNNSQSPITSNQEKVFETTSQSKQVNYFALMEVAFGLVLLAKATDISKKIESNFDANTDRPSVENNS